MRTLAILFLAALQLMNGRSYAALASGGKSGDVPDSDRLLKKKGKKGKKKSKSPTASPTSTSGPTGSPFPTYNPTTTQYPTPVCNLPTKSNIFTVTYKVGKVTPGNAVLVTKVEVDGGLLSIGALGFIGDCALTVFDSGETVKKVCNTTEGTDVVCDVITPEGRQTVYDIVLTGNCDKFAVDVSNSELID